MTVSKSLYLSVTITRPYEDVYAFLAEAKNFPLWAAGLGKLREQTGSQEFTYDTVNGSVAKVVFAKANEYGVVDHTVTPESAGDVYVPLRVLRNGDGADVVFTLFQITGMTDAQFVEDSRMVQKDLEALKKLLES